MFYFKFEFGMTSRMMRLMLMIWLWLRVSVLLIAPKVIGSLFFFDWFSRFKINKMKHWYHKQIDSMLNGSFQIKYIIFHKFKITIPTLFVLSTVQGSTRWNECRLSLVQCRTDWIGSFFNGRPMAVCIYFNASTLVHTKVNK